MAQNPNNAAGGAGGAGGNQGGLGGQPPVKIMLFMGDEKDVTPNQWTETVQRAQQVAGWTDAQTAAVAIEHLRARANTWRETLAMGTEAERATLTNWPGLRDAFIARFTDTASAQQKVSLFLGLSQKEGEPSDDFFDRTDYAIKKCTMAEYNQQANGDARRGFVSCRETVMKLLFMRGLLPSVRAWVEGVIQNENPGIEEIKMAAKRADASLKSRAKGGAAPIGAMTDGSGDGQPDPTTQTQKEIEKLRQQLAAMSAGKQKDKKKQQPGAKKSSADVKNIPMEDRDWILCFRCGQWGQHFAHECGISREDAKKMTRQSQADRPTGKPHDRQFPPN